MVTGCAPVMKCRSTILRGNPADVIAAYATEHQVDLAVMSTHGWGAVKRFWLGSVADKVIRGSRSALLVAHPA